MISIIIPALNEEKNIERCLSSIKDLNTPKEFYEVILVDNGSTDKTCEIACSFKKDLNNKIFVKTGVTISALRNFGVHHSKGDLLAFVDADCTVSADWINSALKYLDDCTIGAIGYSYGIPEDSSWVAKCLELNTDQKRKHGDTENLPAGNLFVTKKNFLNVGGFNEDLITNEDYDFCFRLKKKGLRIIADPNISVIHWGTPQTLKEFYRKQKWHGTHVFKVFLDNIWELKNFRAVSYALYYVFCIVSFFLSLYISLTYHSFLSLNLSILATIAPPIILSIKTLISQKKPFIYLLGLSVLYFFYGIARAVSILKVNNRLTVNKSKES